jgi:hypothetical protein
MPKAITIEPIDGKPGKPGQVYYPFVFVLSSSSLPVQFLPNPNAYSNKLQTV